MWRGPLTDWLQPLKGGLWIAFLICTAMIAVEWTAEVGPAQIENAVGNADLRATLVWLSQVGDFFWLTLAAANIYGWIAVSESLNIARRWAFSIAAGVFVVLLLSVHAGYPLGKTQFAAAGASMPDSARVVVFQTERMQFTKALGVSLAGVPVGALMLWFVVIVGAWAAARVLLPRASHAAVSIGAGVLIGISDWNIEPVAARMRSLWFWRGEPPGLPFSLDPPLANPLVWLMLGGLAAWTLRGRVAVPNWRAHGWKPATIFGLLNAVFLLAHLGRFFRN